MADLFIYLFFTSDNLTWFTNNINFLYLAKLPYIKQRGVEEEEEKDVDDDDEDDDDLPMR